MHSWGSIIADMASLRVSDASVAYVPTSSGDHLFVQDNDRGNFCHLAIASGDYLYVQDSGGGKAIV